MNRLSSSEKRPPRQALPLLLILSAIAIALPKSGEMSSPASKASANAATSTARTAAMRVQIDPETGELVPAVGDGSARPLSSAPSHSVQGLQVTSRPDGSRSVHLEGRFMESYVATIDSMGHTHLDCLPEEHAERFVHASARPAPAGAVER